MATVWSFLSEAVRPAAHKVTEWTGCDDDQRWLGELKRGRRGSVAGGGIGVRDSSGCLLFLLCPPSYHRHHHPQTLPSADSKSCFDWISHELMRQAWRTASVVEISYHILIRPLCQWRVCLCDLMGLSPPTPLKASLMDVFFFKAPNGSGFVCCNWIVVVTSLNSCWTSDHRPVAPNASNVWSRIDSALCATNA